MNNNLQHCNMDIIAEELSCYEDITILILGAHECSYFVHKFSNDNIYSYLLTDKELGLGNYDELIESIKELESNNRKLVIISTCVAQMVNIRADIEFQLGARTVFINGSDFKTCTDILQTLYEQLLLKENIEIKDKKSILKENYNNFEELRDDIFCKQVLYNDKKYELILNHLQDKHGVTATYATN